MRSLSLSLASALLLLLTGMAAVQAERVEVDEKGNVHYLNGAKSGGGSSHKSSGGKKSGAPVVKAGKSSAGKTVAKVPTKSKSVSSAPQSSGRATPTSSSGSTTKH